jgi:hypothetical protein
MLEVGARATCQQSEAIQGQESGGSERALELEGERPEGEGVEEQVGEVSVDESAGDECRIFTALNEPEWAKQVSLDQRRHREQADEAGQHDGGEKYRRTWGAVGKCHQISLREPPARRDSSPRGDRKVVWPGSETR